MPWHGFPTLPLQIRMCQNENLAFGKWHLLSVSPKCFHLEICPLTTWMTNPLSSFPGEFCMTLDLLFPETLPGISSIDRR